MSFSEHTNRPVETSRSNTLSSVEQLLRGRGEGGGDLSRIGSSTSSSPSSPYFERLKLQDTEEEGLFQKKSVLSKMKEKAKKFRNSLKKRQDDDNFTPSWGVSLEDDAEEQDAEYLGAPMYESELAPERYKENARQHPRADPVISEKHVLQTTNVKQDGENKTMTETITEKITPLFSVASDGTNSASSKTTNNSAVSSTPNANYMSSQTTSTQNSSASCAPLYATPNQKGATGKDYLVKKLESKEDAKTVSQPQPQTQLISKSTTPGDAGVMDKVKGAVNTLLGNEEPSQQYGTKTNTTPASLQTEQVDQEAKHVRFLQTN